MNNANDQLSRLTTALFVVADAAANAPADPYGYDAQQAQLYSNNAEIIAQLFGYPTLNDALDAIEQRTTRRWVGLSQLAVL